MVIDQSRFCWPIGMKQHELSLLSPIVDSLAKSINHQKYQPKFFQCRISSSLKFIRMMAKSNLIRCWIQCKSLKHQSITQALEYMARIAIKLSKNSKILVLYQNSKHTCRMIVKSYHQLRKDCNNKGTRLEPSWTAIEISISIALLSAIEKIS